MLIFDCGYNEGNFTREALIRFPDAKIVGVDANRDYFVRAVQTERVTVLHRALSDTTDQSILFFVCDSNPGISSCNVEWINKIRHSHFFRQTMRSVGVQTISLDAMIQKYGKPDLIKLDIEGHELKALQGLSAVVDLLFFEWSEEFFEQTEKCIERLKQIGFSQFATIPRREGDQDSFFDTNLVYTDWESLRHSLDIQPNRKLFWGMIYAK